MQNSPMKLDIECLIFSKNYPSQNLLVSPTTIDTNRIHLYIELHKYQITVTLVMKVLV